MLIISEAEFLEELKSDRMVQENVVQTEDHTKEHQIKNIELENNTYDNFRKPAGVPNIPGPVKAIIGALALETTHSEVAASFPVSKQTVGELARGDQANAEITEVKNAIIEKIKDNSLKKIEQCVEFLSVNEHTKNSELIMVAEGLSRVHDKLTPKDANPHANITQFIYYVPESQKKIEDYTVIDADQ